MMAADSKPKMLVQNPDDLSIESLAPEQWKRRKQIHCRELLDYIYKEITLKNLEKSYDRLTKKLLLAYITLYKNANKGQLTDNIILIYLTNSLKQLDPDFEAQLNSHKYVNVTKKVWPLIEQYGTNNDFHQIIRLWKHYQNSTPELFKGLDKEYFLDNWDETSAGIIGSIDKLAPGNEKLTELQKKFEKPDLIAKGKLRHDPVGLKKEAMKVQSDVMKTINDIYLRNLDNYKHICDENDMQQVLLTLNECAPRVNFARPNMEGVLQLNRIAEGLSRRDLGKSFSPPKILSFGDLEIKEYKYPVNPKGEYCTRNPEIVDTIVIHHTATSTTTTPTEINQLHMDRSTRNEQWHMIGYHYLIHGRYEGANFGPEEISISRGRPENMVGAHAGGHISKYSAEQRDVLEAATLSCGLDGQNFKDIPIKDTMDRNKKINGNYGTIGIAVVGNYKPSYYFKVDDVVTRINEGGHRAANPSEEVLRKLSKLMCDIQKRNPRVKNFKPHQFYKMTECPGRIKKFFDKIKFYTKELGCEFSY